MPAAVAASTSPPVESSVFSKQVVSPANKRPLIFMGAAIALGLLLALFCLALFTFPSLMNRLGQRGIIPIGQNSTSLPAASLASAATLSAIKSETTLAFTPSPEGALIAVQPTGTPVSYELLIVRAGDGNSLMVLNLTADSFPLSLLRLGNGKDGISGSAWGVDNLASGECVGVWKAGEDHIVPGGFNCQLVGTRRELKKKDLLGGETFLVYYAGKPVGQCDKNQNQCAIRILP